MRELTLEEIGFVAGAGDDCSGGSGNSYGGVTDTSVIGKEIIEIYEGMIEATSYAIERVANALK